MVIMEKKQYKSGKDTYLSLAIDLLISNNFSSMTFFAQRVFYELSVIKV